MCLTKMLSSSFHNIFLACVPLISFFSSDSVSYNCRGQMEACDFRHTQIKSLSLWENWERFLNSLLFSLVVCVCYYITPCFIGSRCWRAWGPQTLNPISSLCFVLIGSLLSVRRYMVGYRQIAGHWPTYTFSHVCPHMPVFVHSTQFLGSGMCQHKTSHCSDRYLQQSTVSDLHCATGQITVYHEYSLACSTVANVRLQGLISSIDFSVL